MRLALRRVLIFGVVALAIGLYFSRDESFSTRRAVVAGLLCGAAVLIAELRFSRDPDKAREHVLNRFSYTEVVAGAIGLALLVVGAIVGSVGLAVSGLTFVGLAAVLLGAKAALRRDRN